MVRTATSVRTARSVRNATWVAASIGALLASLNPSAALASGAGHNVLLIIDPDQADSLEIGHYYQQMRGIPDSNVLYMAPGADDYSALTQYQLPAIWGEIASRGLEDHIDFIVIPPGSSFYVSAPDLVGSGGCTPVRRFALSSAYTLAYEADSILGGGLTIAYPNGYEALKNSSPPLAFDSSVKWLNGEPSAETEAHRYFIGAMLGYSGERGNSVEEIREMIRRSVESDSSSPDGTFYLMKTEDRIRSGTRDFAFANVVSFLDSLGGRAEVIEGVLPEGRHDALGVMTGHAAPQIAAADMTLLPGAFADHLTSYAATFDTGSQTKMSEWIAKGASGTAGTVEEPCAVLGKFPHPAVFAYYYQGLTLGEAVFRSLGYAPFHTLLLGDPLTNPFGEPPQLEVSGLPSGPVSGSLTLTTSVTTVAPARAQSVEVFVDGRLRATADANGPITLNARALAEGSHMIRVVAYDDRPERNQASWSREFRVRNNAAVQEPGLSVATTQAETDDVLRLDVTGVEGASEVRILQNGRVLAARNADTGPLTTTFTAQIQGILVGPGTSWIQAEVEFPSGTRARSAPVTVEVDNVRTAAAGERVPAELPLTAWSYTRDLVAGQPALIDIPVSGRGASIQMVEVPADLDIKQDGGTILVESPDQRTGTDELSLRIERDDEATEASIQLRYCAAPSFTSSPGSQRLCPGEHTFTVEAVPANAGHTSEWLEYRWYLDGTPVAADGSSLTLSLNPGEGHLLRVEAFEWCGDVRSLAYVEFGVVARNDRSACRPRVFLPVSYSSVVD